MGDEVSAPDSAHAADSFGVVKTPAPARVWTLDELIGELRRYDPSSVVTFDIRGEWGPPAAGRFRLAHPIPADVEAVSDAPDEHAQAKHVGREGGEIAPAVLCWALVADRVCVLPLDVIDLVCPVHGKRRPPP